MLSNTATPKYYGEFRQQVLRGEIAVNTYVSQQMNLIDNLIADPRYYYDDEAVEGWIRFCEAEMTLVDGSPAVVLPSFKLWAEDLLAWFYFEERSVYVKDHFEIRKVKKRLRNKQLIILGRGGAKSMYASWIHSYYLSCNPSTTYQIAVAPTVRQAEETLYPIKTALTQARGPLYKFYTDGSLQNTTGNRMKRIKMTSTKKGIENFITGSILETRPLDIDKLQGLRCKVATLDEWLSGDIREDPIGAIEQSAAKLDNYIIVAISSEGNIRNGPGDSIKMEAKKILRGEYPNPHESIWYYCLDDIKEVSNPAMWVKAQPNIGKTVQYDTYQLEVERMEHNPSIRNDTLAKRFGIELEGFTYYFSYEETHVHPFRTCDGMPCSLGADLSMGDDFCSFAFLFPLGRDRFRVKTLNFITKAKYDNLSQALRHKYDTFQDEQTLIVMEGVVLDMDLVYDELYRFIEAHDYDIRSFGYDPYNADTFVKRYQVDFGMFCIEKVIQGSRTESVPLGELKHLSEARLLEFDEQIMSFAIGNCVVSVDSNGNRKLYKLRNSEKIDPVAATMDAYIAYKANAINFD